MAGAGRLLFVCLGSVVLTGSLVSAALGVRATADRSELDTKTASVTSTARLLVRASVPDPYAEHCGHQSIRARGP
jgi:hypothetical protein